MKLFCSETSSFVWTARHHLHNIKKSIILTDHALEAIIKFHKKSIQSSIILYCRFLE